MKKIARFTIVSVFTVSFFMAVVNSISSEYSSNYFHYANIIPVSPPVWPGK